MTEALALAAIAFAFLCGSLPSSSWIARRALGRDLRDVGDGNPGATNVYKAGGVRWGLLALLLDVTKGVVPVGLAARFTSVDGVALALVACSAPLGHAFSPWMRGRGGKALATTLGAWIGLTFDVTPLIAAGALVIWSRFLANDAWAVVWTLATLGVAVAVIHPDRTHGVAWAGHCLLIVWTHRRALRAPPNQCLHSTRSEA